MLDITMRNTLRRNGVTGENYQFKICSSSLSLADGHLIDVPYLEHDVHTKRNQPSLNLSRKEAITLNSIQELLNTSATDISQIAGEKFTEAAVQKNLIAERCAPKGIATNTDKIASHNKATKRALDTLIEKGWRGDHHWRSRRAIRMKTWSYQGS